MGLSKQERVKLMYSHLETGEIVKAGDYYKSIYKGASYRFAAGRKAYIDRVIHNLDLLGAPYKLDYVLGGKIKPKYRLEVFVDSFYFDFLKRTDTQGKHISITPHDVKCFHLGEGMLLADYLAKIGLNYSSFQNRLYSKKWSFIRAISVPIKEALVKQNTSIENRIKGKGYINMLSIYDEVEKSKSKQGFRVNRLKARFKAGVIKALNELDIPYLENVDSSGIKSLYIHKKYKYIYDFYKTRQKAVIGEHELYALKQYKKPLKEVLVGAGITRDTFYQRIYSGWSWDRAINTPYLYNCKNGEKHHLL